MFARNSRLIAAATLLCLLSMLSAPAGAQITVGGDAGEVSPANPATWWNTTSSGTTGYIGYHSGGTGTITVGGGSRLSSVNAYLGYETSSVGTVTISGLNSTWTNNGYLGITVGMYVGYRGIGTVMVQSKGKVTSTATYLGYYSGSTGNATVTGIGSTWACGGLSIGNMYGGAGTLTVSNGGQVTTNGAQVRAGGRVTITDTGSTWTIGSLQALGYTLEVTSGGRMATNSAAFMEFGTTTITGTGSTWTGGVAYLGIINPNGTLTVENGGAVNLSTLYASLNSLKGDGTISTKGLVADDMNLAFDATHGASQVFSFGTGGALNLNLDGTGDLGAGARGTGTLRIADGVKVASSGGYVGYYTFSHGTAVITGTGSTWTANYLSVGEQGTGMLTVGNGGKVAAKIGVSVDTSASTVNLHVSGDGMIVVGNATTPGSITNKGKVNLYADAFLAANTYSPITEIQGRAITWSGTGSYNAYGGTWNSSAHIFTVAAATVSASGVPNMLATSERLLITDSASGKRIGASFGTVAGGTNFSAVPLGGADLSGLPADQTVLGAWNFPTNFASDQALLAFDIGAGQSGTLAVWHYDGITWTSFAAPDLTYGDDGIANFAVTGFGGYAVTTAVPEPASMALLVTGALTLVRRRGQ